MRRQRRRGGRGRAGPARAPGRRPPGPAWLFRHLEPWQSTISYVKHTIFVYYDIDSILTRYRTSENDLRYRDTIFNSISKKKYSISMHYDIEETSISNLFLSTSTHYDIEETSISNLFISISTHHDIEETSISNLKCKTLILVYTVTYIEDFFDIDKCSGYPGLHTLDSQASLVLTCQCQGPCGSEPESVAATGAAVARAAPGFEGLSHGDDSPARPAGGPRRPAVRRPAIKGYA
jgi:hypothetical protein